MAMIWLCSGVWASAPIGPRSQPIARVTAIRLGMIAMVGLRLVQVLCSIPITIRDSPILAGDGVGGPEERVGRAVALAPRLDRGELGLVQRPGLAPAGGEVLEESGHQPGRLAVGHLPERGDHGLRPAD